MDGTLIELIDRLDEVDDSDGFDSKSLYALGGSSAQATARAMIASEGEGECETGSLVCSKDPDLTYVLMVQLAKEAIEVWSEWRGGAVPNRQDKYEAVMFYSRHDCYLPVDEP